MIGKTPTATTNDTPRAAKSPEYVQVQPGDKLSAIALS
jgi:LysM repeat protein